MRCVSLLLWYSRNLSWLILDEPTHNLDTEGVEKLAYSMKHNLPSLVDQIFIITHDEGMESAVSASLYRLDRQKDKDEPSSTMRISA